MLPSLKLKVVLASLGSLAVMSTASAKIYVNSMCTMKAGTSTRTIEGDANKDKKFPLASISKVVTALWAIEKLGVHHRFTTKLHVNKVGSESYDVHIEGSHDPIFGRNAGYFLLSELNRAGIDIKQIENLTFDENFLLEWDLEENRVVSGDTRFYRDIADQVAAVKASIKTNLGTAVHASRYSQLKAKAAKRGITMAPRPRVSIRNVEFKASEDFNKPTTAVTYLYRSAPLHQILKNMNNKSNNYIADHLFWHLGGTEEFDKFVQSSLSMDDDDLVFNLGSGNNADYIYGGQEVYNRGTCEAMIKVLFKLDTVLQRKGLSLTDVMAVAGTDRISTVSGMGGTMSGSVVAKTGTVNRAKTLSGTVSTENGIMYFAILMNTDVYSEKDRAGLQIRRRMIDLIARNGGPAPIQYEELVPLPFDKDSALVDESTIRVRPRG